VLRTFAGGLGLAALVAATVVGAFAAYGAFGSYAPASFTTGKPPAAAPAVTGTANPESATAGELRWTVEEVRRVGELRSYTSPPSTERGDFLVVTFTVENLSGGPITLTGDSMALVSGDGRTERPVANLNAKFVAPEEDLLFSESGLLDGKEKKRGRVNFSLSAPFGGTRSGAGLSGLELEVGDANPTAENEKRLNLRF